MASCVAGVTEHQLGEAEAVPGAGGAGQGRGGAARKWGACGAAARGIVLPELARW